jgi:hypothetical protein
LFGCLICCRELEEGESEARAQELEMDITREDCQLQLHNLCVSCGELVLTHHHFLLALVWLVDVTRYREGEQVVVPEGVLFGLTAPEEVSVVERRRREVRGVEVISEVSALLRNARLSNRRQSRKHLAHSMRFASAVLIQMVTPELGVPESQCLFPIAPLPCSLLRCRAHVVSLLPACAVVSRGGDGARACQEAAHHHRTTNRQQAHGNIQKVS